MRVSPLAIRRFTLKMKIESKHWNDLKISMLSIWRWPLATRETQGAKANENTLILSKQPNASSFFLDRNE